MQSQPNSTLREIGLVDTVSGSSENVDAKLIAWYKLYKPFSIKAYLIWKFGEPIVCMFGLFGNCMIILIMLRLPASTSSVFFQVLAWADLLLLMLYPFNGFLNEEFGVPYFKRLGSWQCKLHSMVTYTAGVVAPWMLVALTMLRAASVLWPLRVNAVWTTGKSRATAGIMTVVIVLMHCHILYGRDVTSGKRHCVSYVVSETYSWFFDEIWSWVDMTVTSLAPFMLLGVSNSLLLWTLIRSVRTDTRLSVQQATQDSRQQKVTSLTVTLIVTSVAFFLLTLPTRICYMADSYIDFIDPIQVGQYDMFLAASQILWYSNSAINFYLYCLTGSKFRTALTDMILDLGTILRNLNRFGKQKVPRSVTPM